MPVRVPSDRNVITWSESPLMPTHPRTFLPIGPWTELYSPRLHGDSVIASAWARAGCSSCGGRHRGARRPAVTAGSARWPAVTPYLQPRATATFGSPPAETFCAVHLRPNRYTTDRKFDSRCAAYSRKLFSPSQLRQRPLGASLVCGRRVLVR